MTFINVIVIQEGVVYENILVSGEEPSVVASRAEVIFLDKCQERISNWDDYTPQQRQAVLDDGYERFGTGSVCISWPAARPR